MVRIYGIGLFLMLIELLLNSCAEPAALRGGPKDKIPPKLDSSRYSTPNYQTGFDEDEIILTFNEWVVLKNAFNQVLISPPTDIRPDIFVKNKSVVLRFKEPLIENTTYTIQFGEAVVDYTENNPAKNLRFVFSTGAELDSLQVQGQIVDAITNKAMGEVWVMLYDQLSDSTPIKDRPLYVTKTDKNGQFLFENIREDSFRIFALDDKNANYKFDQVQEAIAFYEEAFYLTDSMKGAFKLRMFEQDPDLMKQKVEQNNKDELVFTFNKEIYDSLIVRPLVTLSTDFQEQLDFDGTVLRYWWKGLPQEWDLLLEVPALGWRDTVNVEADSMLEYAPWGFTKTSKTEAEGKGKNSGKAASTPTAPQFYQGTTVLLSRPLARLDTAQMALLDTAQQARPVSWSSKGRKLRLRSQAKPGNYQLVIYPGGLTDLWGNSNKDTLRQELIKLDKTELGNILAKIIHADSSKQYIIQLVDDQEKVLEEAFVTNKKTIELSYKNQLPQQYYLQVIHDEDGNGRWTNGLYLSGQQPETITRSKAIKLRANWDNEIEIDLDPGVGKKGKK